MESTGTTLAWAIVAGLALAVVTWVFLSPWVAPGAAILGTLAAFVIRRFLGRALSR